MSELGLVRKGTLQGLGKLVGRQLSSERACMTARVEALELGLDLFNELSLVLHDRLADLPEDNLLVRVLSEGGK